MALMSDLPLERSPVAGCTRGAGFSTVLDLCAAAGFPGRSRGSQPSGRAAALSWRLGRLARSGARCQGVGSPPTMTPAPGTPVIMPRTFRRWLLPGSSA